MVFRNGRNKRYTPPGEAPKYQIPQAQSPFDFPIAMYFGSKWSRLFDAQHHGLFDMRKRIAAKAPLWSYDFDDPSAYTRHEVDAGDALVVAANCVQVGVGAPEGREDCFFLQCLLESRRASRAETDQVQFEFRDGRNLICEISVALREPLTRAIAAGIDPFPHLPHSWLLKSEESIEGEHAQRYSELRRAELARHNLI